jgi:hypothetical protein
MSALHCLLTVTLGLTLATEPELFLDLTAPQVKQMDHSNRVGCSAGGGLFVDDTPFRPPKLTVSLEIEWLNQKRFDLSEEAVGEVRLTNTGNQPIMLPWSLDSDIVYGKDCRDLEKPKPPGTLVGSLYLKLADSQGRAKLIGGHNLFALRDDEATYRVLAPQQSARIRLGGKVHPPDVPIGSAGATNHFEVTAVFDLTDSSLPNAYQTVTSTNHKDVTVVGM